MNTRADKASNDKSRLAANAASQKPSDNVSTFQMVDNRPIVAVYRKFREMSDNSLQVNQLRVFEEMASKRPVSRTGVTSNRPVTQLIPKNLLTQFQNVSPAILAKIITNLTKKSPLRESYKKQVMGLQSRLPQYIAGSLSAMDIGADPAQEAEPPVAIRQQLKEEARVNTPAWMMDWIRERQIEKYGDSGGSKVADPTAVSLILKNMRKKGLSPEQAAEQTMLSSARPDPDIFKDIEPWLGGKSREYTTKILIKMVQDKQVSEDDLSRMIKVEVPI